ncbi:MAG: TIGR01777 family oxidoreductase [Candidatus Oleimicrobiaceae bacterium]
MCEARRVIVTGASGLIGRRLCAHLSQQGYEVVALSRSPASFPDLGPGVEVVAWNARDSSGLCGVVEGAYGIVHLAGENLATGRWTRAKKARIVESRLTSGMALAEALTRINRRPEVFVQASAVGYYPAGAREPFSEDAAPGVGFLSDLVVRWERSTAQVEQLGIRRVIVRSALVLTRTGGILKKLLLPFRLGVGGHFGSGEQPFPWITLADEVAAIAFLLGQQAASGPYNLAAPEMVTMREFCHRLGKVMRRPSWFHVPAAVLRLFFGQMADDVLLTGSWVSPWRLLELGFTFQYGELDAALQHLLQRRPDLSCEGGS